MGLDPYRRRLCHGQRERHRQGRHAPHAQHEFRDLLFVLPRRGAGLRAGRWPHRQYRRPPGAGAANRCRHGALCREQGRGCRLHPGAGSRGGRARHPGERGGTLDHRHASQPRCDAEGRPRRLAETRGDRRHDRIPGLARQQSDDRRSGAGHRGERGHAAARLDACRVTPAPGNPSPLPPRPCRAGYGSYAAPSPPHPARPSPSAR